MSVTPIFDRLACRAAALAVAMAVGAVTARAQEMRFVSPHAAFEQGIGAYRAGYFEIAIPALEHSVAKGDATSRFFSAFYLARIYADNSGAQTDHAKAYMLFRRLADEHADIDPDDGTRAPFVAKALTAVAGYVRDGLAEIGLKPDVARAVEYLRHAATFFNEKDAQFELARIFLRPDGSREERDHGIHYLATLSQDGYPAAQALLAELHWRGRIVDKDERRALALIHMAVENAPPHERIWIEDTHQNIFCGASPGVRKQAEALVAAWRHSFRQASRNERPDPGVREVGPARTCANGEPVELLRLGPGRSDLAAPVRETLHNAAPSGATPPDASGLIDAGQRERTR